MYVSPEVLKSEFVERNLKPLDKTSIIAVTVSAAELFGYNLSEPMLYVSLAVSIMFQN